MNLCFTHLCLLIDVILRLGGELIVNLCFILNLYYFIDIHILRLGEREGLREEFF
jgi:hypothetical protein